MAASYTHPLQWPAADEQVLRDNYGKLSLGKISKLLDGRYSPSAVIGKARRLKLGCIGEARRIQHFRETCAEKRAAQAKEQAKERAKEKRPPNCAPRFRPSVFMKPPRQDTDDPIVVALLSRADEAERRRDSWRGAHMYRGRV